MPDFKNQLTARTMQVAQAVASPAGKRHNRDVTLTRLITQFTYRIEPKAGGGFTAYAS